MQHDYDILLNAKISLGGKFTGETLEEAKAGAVAELRKFGELTDLDFERTVMLDEQES